VNRPADGDPVGILIRLPAVAVGGALGTFARYAVGRALPVPAHGFPWSTWLVNVSGSLLVGLALTLAVERFPGAVQLRPFVVIGFCGGFTTFSTMAVEAVQLGRHHAAGVALLYLASSMLAGPLAAAAGTALAHPGRGGLRGARAAVPDPDDVGTLGP
jgi:fluoride exporter